MLSFAVDREFSMRRAIGMLLVLLTAGVAQAADDIRIVSHEAGDDLLRFTFNQPMLGWENNVALRDVRIEPVMDCRWFWSDDITLACSRPLEAKPPQPATKYTIHFNGGVWSQQGVEIKPTTLSLAYQRPEISIYGGSDWTDGRPVAELSANQLVDDAELRKVLRVTGNDGLPLGYRLHPMKGWSTADRSRWELILDNTAYRGDLDIAIKPGLKGRSGLLPGAQDQHLASYAYNEEFQFRGARCARSSPSKEFATKSVRCEAGTNVLLRFSRPLSKEALEMLDRQLPAGVSRLRSEVMERLYRNGADRTLQRAPEWTVALALERPNEQFPVTLPAALRSADGEPLQDNAGILIESSDLVGSFTQQGTRRVLLPGEDVGPLGVATNLDWVRLDQGIYGADQRIANKPVKRKLRSDNQAHEVALARKPSRAWRRDGGWIDGRIGGAFGTTDYSIINAPLHLAALRSRNAVLVWASQWSDHAARAGISVELLRRNDDKLLPIASAITQADGVATLAVADGGGDYNRWEGAVWIVRVRDGDKTTYLPLEGDIAGERESSSIDYSDGVEDGAGMIWGVTDRPLYRPGETVRYRLWSAARDRNRLRLGESGDQLDLVLDEGAGYWNSRPWQEWTATLDAHGSVSGERILPKDIVDGSFCIGKRNAGGGACFRVANHHASALWAETSVERKVVHVGEMLDVVVEAGYYSGGAAAGARAEPATLLMPTPLEEAYPAYADYRFIDPHGNEHDGGEALGDGSRPVATLDNEGRHRFRIAARNPRIDDNPGGEFGRGIPFGTLKINSGVSVSSASMTSSSTAELFFSRFREFVGIKFEGGLTIDSDPKLAAIVINAEGQASADTRPIRIDILPKISDHDEGLGVDKQEAIAHCMVEPGRATPCAFRAPAPGYYRFRAQRDGAATVELLRYLSSAKAADTDRDSDATMERVGDDVILRQPFARAKVLFAAQHGQVLSHWIVDVDQSEYRFAFPAKADWAPGITLGALVLDTGNPDPRQRARGLWKTAALDISMAREIRSPLTIQVPSTPSRPGMPVEIRLSNNGSTLLDVTITVIDEALRVQATDEVDLQKPQADAWLGAMEHWSVPRWSALSQWVEPGKLIRLLALTKPSDIGASSDEPVKPVPEVSWDSAADKLESVVVTGSRIRAADLFSEGTRPDRKLRSSTATSGQSRDARLRQNFADTAYWQPSLTIAPGATETIQVPLPDNLTRWRVVAWSNDGQAFHLDESDITSSMPVEARIEAPSRLFPGDQCDIALSARNRLGGPALMDLQLRASGAGIDLQRRSTATVNQDHETRVIARLGPAQEGRIDLQGRVNAGDESDAVAASVPVHSSFGRDRVALAGWLGDEALLLRRPNVPAGATDIRLKLAVHRQLDGLVSAWIRGLHEYPHRCWEQQLSRAVGAAAALRIGKPELWPDAAALIDEVLRNAPAFRQQGLYNFFPATYGEPKSPPYLTVYSLQVFEVLKAWGHAVPQPLIDQARAAIDEWVKSTFGDRGKPTKDDQSVLMAYLAIADRDVARKWIDKVQDVWPSLAPWQRSTLLIALSNAQPDSADIAQRRDELIAAAPLRGGRRVLDVDDRRLFALGSNLRDQCAVIDALQRTGAASMPINEWQRGLVDLYSGGSWSTDSQASARCLMGLLGASQPSQRIPVKVSVKVGAERRVIDLSADDDQQELVMAWPESAGVQLQANAADAMVGFVGELDYQIDQRHSTESSSGLRIERDYAVLRNGKWVPVGSSTVADGSWVRVRLVVQTAALRHHVAVVDKVPGGLRPEDLSLDRVAGVELADADTGTPWFETRQLVDTEARFYADALPPGSHDVIYYTRAAHRGDFLALPARAELMYGRASVARTAATRLKIVADDVSR